MKEINLEDLYLSIEMLKMVGIDMPEGVLKQVEKLENQLISKEVVPIIHNNIEPPLRQIGREITLVLDYHPDKPISIRIARKSDLSDLSTLDETTNKKRSNRLK